VLVWISGAVAVVVVGWAGGAAAAARFDERHDAEFLPGVTVSGIAVGGMTSDAAYRLLSASIEDPLDRPFTVTAASHAFSATPRQLGVRTDLRAQLGKAATLQRSIPLSKRVWHRLTGSPVDARYRVTPTVDQAAVGAFVGRVAAAVDLPPRNSVPELEAGDTLQFTPAVPGRALDRSVAARRIADALGKGEPRADLSVTPLAPATTPDSFPDVLVVKIGDNKLLHFHTGALVKTYDVATGSQRYPTPTGRHRIVGKRYRPTWVNPAKYPGGWGAGLPARIGPGAGNPLGTRAMALDASGILIHGTSNGASIGYNVSHGCIRMRMAEVEELFDLVGVGTPVLVMQTAPLRSQPSPPPGPTLEDLAEAQVTHLPAAPAAPAQPGASAAPAQPGAPAVIPAAPGAQNPLVPSPSPTLPTPPGTPAPPVPSPSPTLPAPPGQDG
jgi:lipoprotein-anchoring transpeptidase ErfK/SrfK